MAMLRRQSNAGQERAFTTRLSYDIYDKIEKFAWDNKMSFALAVNVLLREAIKLNNNKPIQPMED